MKLKLSAYIASEDNLDAQTLEYFYFLNKLRESGVTNMLLAGPYLQEEFDQLDRYEAKRVLLAWIKWVESNPSNTELGL